MYESMHSLALREPGQVFAVIMMLAELPGLGL